MTTASFAVGLAVIFAYVTHHLIYSLALYGKLGFKMSDVEDRAQKMYLFGMIGVLSMHFSTAFGAVFSWLTFVAFFVFYTSAGFNPEYNRRKFFVLGGIFYTSMLTVWWVGQMISIFVHLKV